MPKRFLAGLVLLLASTVAAAQSWPTRPIKLVVPFPAGGPTDVMTRVLAEKLSTALGQQVVVDNRPGAGGSIGADYAAKAQPDGYTLLMATGSTHSVGPYLQKLPYDPYKDFTPIVYVGTATNVLLVSPKLGVKSVRELIAYAKQSPGRLTYASSGVGSVAHLTAEMFAAMAGVKLTHVPYKGTQLAVTDMMAGSVGILFDSIFTAKPLIESHRLDGLAISSAQRSPILPDLPTVAESGLPGFESSNYFGLYGPANLPRPVADRVDTELNKILSDAAVRERFHALGFEVTGGNGAALTRVMQAEAAKWSKVIRDANVKVE